MNLDDLLRKRISPILSGEGFKGTNRRYLRRVGGFEHVVTISKGQGMMQGKFAISLEAHPMIDGLPGLPKLPLTSGDHWLGTRLAPQGRDDKWWWSDTLYPSDVDEIVSLLTQGTREWFSDVMSLAVFSENWFRQVFNIEYAAKRLSITTARLAYLQAAIFASLGQTGTALKIAATARSLAGPKATLFLAHVDELEAILRGRLS